MKVGDAVRFNVNGGSIGEIIESVGGVSITESLTVRFHVRWYYGLDVYDQEVTSISRWVPDWQLVLIDRDAMEKHRHHRFNGGGCSCGLCLRGTDA